MQRKLYEVLASALTAHHNCVASGNDEWRDRHAAKLDELTRAHLPHGSGFDSGTKFELDESKPERLVFTADFHHMDNNGYYDGWTCHQVIVTPSLASGINLRITGRDRDDWKDYAYQVFHEALTQMVEA
jgi:hypothetical protein